MLQRIKEDKLWNRSQSIIILETAAKGEMGNKTKLKIWWKRYKGLGRSILAKNKVNTKEYDVETLRTGMFMSLGEEVFWGCQGRWHYILRESCQNFE